MMICPRCKERTLDPSDCGESSLYGSNHLLCNPCFEAEDMDIEEAGTNDLPEILIRYGAENNA